MYQATRVEPGAGDMSEDEEASLVQECDRTFRTALDQIQQRRRAPARPPSPPSAAVVAEQQYKDCGDSSDVAVESESTTVVKPPSSQNPLEALRQREWLLNLQEEQELQSLKELALKEDHLLFNGEVPPLLPVQPDAPATNTTTVGSTPSTTTYSTTSSSHSTCTTSSATCSTNSTRPGANRGSVGIKGRGSNRSRPPCVHRGNRGRPMNRREQHSQQGGRSGQEHRQQDRDNHRQQGRDNHRQPGRDNYMQQGRENHVQQGRENHVQHGRENHVQHTSQTPSEQGRANSPKKTTEPPGWKQSAVPLSVQDEAAMLAQAIELSHLDDGATSKVEEEQLRIVLEQSRQEARRRGGGNSRRGASRFPRRGWGGPGRGGGAEHCQQMKPPPPPPPVPPNLLNGITIVGSIDAGRLTSGGMPPPLHHTPPPPPSSVNAEPTVTFDQWLSLCSRYMPLLAQGMVELQRTCAAVRSAAPSLEGASLLLPPPLWSSRFPPSAAQSPMSSMGPPPMTTSINSPISAPTAPHSMVPPPVTPPSMTAPSMAPPSMTAPSMAPPSMTAPSMAPPSVVPPPMAPPSMAPPSVTPPSIAPPSMAPPPIGPSHMASGDGDLFSAAASAFQCLHKPVQVQPPRPVLGAGHGAGHNAGHGAGHGAGLHQKNLPHHHLQLSAAHFGGKKQHQHSNEQIRIGGQALGDAGHLLLQNSMQQHPHHQAPVAANAGRLQQHPEQAQGNERGSDDAGHHQHEKPMQLQSPAADTGNKPRTSEQPHAPCRGRAHAKRRTKGGKPTCS